MAHEVVQNPVKMSFRIDDLAISSRNTSSDQSEAVVYSLNWYQSKVQNQDVNTPVKQHLLVPNATSTPLSLPLDKSSADPPCRLLKRKRDDDSVSGEDSSFELSQSKSDNSFSSNSDVDSSEEPKTKSRCLFTSVQVRELEKCYNTNKYLPIEERPALAKRLGLTQQQVKTWFQNRRMKAKRQQKTNTSKYNGLIVTHCAPCSHVTGYNATQLPGYFSYKPQFPGSPVTHVVDSMSCMYGFSPLSPINHPGYIQPVYNGLSPQPSEEHRQ